MRKVRLKGRQHNESKITNPKEGAIREDRRRVVPALNFFGDLFCLESKMTKKELQILERVFAAEIERRLPCQIKSKLAQSLVDKGYLTFGQETLPGRFPVVVKGYYLTFAGRYEYCRTRHESEDE